MTLLRSLLRFVTITALLSANAARADDASAAVLRARALQVLQHELATTSGWIRVHAAEALIEHGHHEGILDRFKPDLATARPPDRIGVWRVLAKVSAPAERTRYLEYLRAALRDPNGPDRVHAAESLAKLDAVSPRERPAIESWLVTADPAIAAYLRWLVVQLSDSDLRADAERDLASLLREPAAAARRRAAYAFTRLERVSSTTKAALHEAAAKEPSHSPVRAYLLVAALIHSPTNDPRRMQHITNLRTYLERGSVAEQFEVAAMLGRARDRTSLPTLVRLLTAPDSDTRIGAASGLLHLLR